MAMTVQDALRLAKDDPVFAKQLLTDPESLKTAFGLTDAQVTAIKAASLNTILGTIPDPAPAAGGGAAGGGGFY